MAVLGSISCAAQQGAAEVASVTAIPNVRIGVLLHRVPQQAWTDEEMERLKTIGFNEVEIDESSGNWGDDVSRMQAAAHGYIPIGGVIVPGEREWPGSREKRAELKQHVALAHKHGLRTLLGFASPNMDRNPYSGDVGGNYYPIDDVTFDSWYDIMNPKVRDRELGLLRAFRRQFPEVDDILVYTYDAGAWQTPEFQYNRFSYGIPLADRLPGYLTALHQVWTEGRTGSARMWWEPWELSAGQVYTMLVKLPRTGFGLIIHSNIAEAQLAQPVDVWFRVTARMCRDLGIPVVAESFFGSATEEIEPLSIPAPRLADEQYQAFMRVSGIVGIKEYYGIDTAIADFDLDLLQARLRNPARSTSDLIEGITQRFGMAEVDVREYLELLSDALQAYPWDASWAARDVGRASTDHGWRGAFIRSGVAPTPAWESTRHARFMKTDDTQPHFWMLEDVELRCRLAADLLDKAGALFSRLLDELSDSADRAQFERIQKDVDVFRRVARSYALHLRETNVAQMLRQDMAAGRPMTATLVKELGQLLDADVVNQQERGRVLEMRRLYFQSPEAFVRRYLIPIDTPALSRAEPYSHDLPPIDQAPPEKGPYTLTTR
jgi:hypothetical protein